MIRTLTGTITATNPESLVIDVHGVGYFVSVPVATSSVPVGSTATLHTYLAVRETALDLYGFTQEADLEVFELLLGASKVGPKSALQILSKASRDLLVEAAQKNDPAYLHKLSGIGKKTCETIVLHLQNKLENLPISTTSQPDALSTIQSDAIDALISLGYDGTTAREIITELTDGEEVTVNYLVTAALKQIN